MPGDNARRGGRWGGGRRAAQAVAWLLVGVAWLLGLAGLCLASVAFGLLAWALWHVPAGGW